MSTARKIAPEDGPAGLKQRARASRESAERRLHAAPNALGEAVPATCAAAKLGEFLEKTWAALFALDDLTTDANRATHEPMECHYRHRIDELELAISYARAASPAGILTQLAVAFDAFDLVTTGADPTIREAAGSRGERCLHSVAAALCAMTGIDREGSCASRYMSGVNDTLAFLSPEVVR
ncbi:hypothetical protein [Methylobacterium sp. J-090]|uniref:hypothetical protein n=1 Tax=Methylobacterium sp. J-090 TaxID=2836666 RepID=UPI001FBB8B76|nr:hypothetical protein [Methylobacterium sp. J-090]MCJ2084292.1 hypothetical protein [Methylobacterium sp. J-090]